MLHKTTMLFTILAAILCQRLQAEEKKDGRLKYLLSACAFFRNEAPFLKEWIEYHRLLGVEHFYLYNSGSKDDFRKILAPYIRKNIVTLINWPTIVPEDEEHLDMWMLSTKIPAYENAARVQAYGKSKWLVFLDVDEFLLPVDKDQLAEILQEYSDYPGIVLSKFCYQAFNVDRAPARKFVIETIEMTPPPYENIMKCTEKMIFRPACYAGFGWPPYKIIFQEEAEPITIAQGVLRINRYLHRFNGDLFFDRPVPRMHIDNRNISPKEFEQLLELGYEIDDQEKAIFRFLPKLTDRVGKKEIK